jgi:hypothetical protein
VTIGGQSFTATSAVGVPSGQTELGHLARWHGAYRVSIPGASAALLTIAPR